MSRAILDVMLLEWGPRKLVERLSNPLWFQGLNNAIGMDWDSSGSTTVTLGILKDVVRPEEDGLAILGGKGRNSLKVPTELRALPPKFNVKPEELERVSFLTAKVDTTLVQDGHILYHHSMLVTDQGEWAVIQQGMNLETKFARRYHWRERENLVVEPHEAIAGTRVGVAVNVTDEDRERTRRLIQDLLRTNPRKVVEEFTKARNALRGQLSLDVWTSGGTTGAISKEAKLVYAKPIDERRVMRILREVYEAQPANLEESLEAGLGPSTARALYLIADLIYGEPPSYRDPVTHPYDPFKYAFAIGGKDGIPYPVKREVAEEVILTLEEIVERAKLEEREHRRALYSLRRLKQGNFSSSGEVGELLSDRRSQETK
ncbi:hypothetical protein HS1genome_2139 [Sulfodiicoccus acidiphilus]|uniref:DUF763 domain-containing protein n=2 Tax=Sulfodiicoccus acidiphilus TaxID=1670455 RepID=A0A348B6E8_9CREN|nr:hypothetical protein HS1genome_2139 [Sulfodiicoccus acidiphilus]GGT98066.1 hypothetical protein GCM10007116_14550 [Sulfodiicoccus acidiphilus]